MNNNFNLKQFLAEGKLLKEEQESNITPEEFKQLLDNIPNKDYFHVIDNNVGGLQDTWYMQSVSAFYREIFDNELKDRYNLSNTDWYDFFNKDNNEDLKSIIKDKIKDICDDYAKQNNIQTKSTPAIDANTDSIPLSPEIKDYIDNTIQNAKDDGEFDYLLDVGFFGTDLADNILTEFMDEYPNAYTLSQEVEDYIDSQL